MWTGAAAPGTRLNSRAGFSSDQIDPGQLGSGRGFDHFADQLQRLDGRNHPRQMTLRIGAAEHGELAGRHENLQDPNALRAILEKHHQFFVFFESFLHASELGQNHRRKAFRLRRRRWIFGSGGEERLLRDLLGKVAECHLGRC